MCGRTSEALHSSRKSPHFKLQRHEPAAPPPASVSCYSPRIHALFETHSGHYHLLDPSEAASTAQDFTKEVGKGGGACGAATRNRYQCFAYATTERILDATRVGAYIGSLVKGEPAACRERVCS